ncbi:MAG: hypothetical protein V1799_07705 [bacterium]
MKRKKIDESKSLMDSIQESLHKKPRQSSGLCCKIAGGMKVDGRLAVKTGENTYIYLEDDNREWQKGVANLIKNLQNQPKFTVYMGHRKDGIEEAIAIARKNDVEVYFMDVPEGWGYEFIAVRNREFQIKGITLRWDPLQPLPFTKEFEMGEMDFRESKTTPDNFLWGWLKLDSVEIPTMVAAQIVTVEQMVEVVN